MPLATEIPILVVEDEVLIRLHLAEVLAEMGHPVHEASDAAEAIAILERHPEIRLIFTDVTMPGTMDGLALAHYVRKRWPPTVIVICSANQKPEVEEMPERANWLSKPFEGATIKMLMNDLSKQLAGPDHY